MIVAVISTIFFYMTLVLELTIWHVPSVASTVRIFGEKSDITDQYSKEYRWVFESTTIKKFVFFVLPLVFIYLLHFYPVMIILDYINDVSKSTTAQYMIGSILVLLGRVLSLNYLFKIKKENKQEGDDFNLHTDGVFKYSRNPGLVSLYISFIGFGMIINSGLLIVCLCVYFAHMHFKVLMEEDFLKNKFGKTYADYLTKSKRYLWF